MPHRTLPVTLILAFTLVLVALGLAGIVLWIYLSGGLEKEKPELTSFQARTAEAYAGMVSKGVTFPFEGESFSIEYHPNPPLFEIAAEADPWKDYFENRLEMVAFFMDKGVNLWEIDFSERFPPSLEETLPKPFAMDRRTLEAYEILGVDLEFPYQDPDFLVEYFSVPFPRFSVVVTVSDFEREKVPRILQEIVALFEDRGVDICRIDFVWVAPNIVGPVPEGVGIGCQR